MLPYSGYGFPAIRYDNDDEEEYHNDDQASSPFESLSPDHFAVTGKTFLVTVDRVSG